MRNYINAYKELIKTITIVIDTCICGFSFILMDRLFRELHHPILFYVSETKVMITLMLTYMVYAVNTSAIFYLKETMGYQVVKQTFKHIFFFWLLSSCILTLGNYLNVFNWFYLTYILFLFVTFTTYRLIGRAFINQLRHARSIQKNVVLVGAMDNNRRLMENLQQYGYAGFNVLGYFNDTESIEMSAGCPYLGKVDDVIPYLKNHQEVMHLYCSLQREMQYHIHTLMQFCENNSVQFFLVPNLYSMLHQNWYVRQLDNTIYLALRESPLNRPENQIAKRLFDIIVSSIILLTIFPFVFVIVAIITKITMPGPIFFKQQRTGFNDEIFECYKFRSMKVNNQADSLQATKNDARKTRWGHLMRKSSIDELPQFINVLKGEMSIVGPRPHMLKHTEEYSKLIDKYMVRHLVKPGITGWSQVNGFRGETKKLKDMEGRVKGDIWYIEHWSLWLDIFIIYKTIKKAILGDKQAY